MDVRLHESKRIKKIGRYMMYFEKSKANIVEICKFNAS